MHEDLLDAETATPRGRSAAEHIDFRIGNEATLAYRQISGDGDASALVLFDRGRRYG